MTARAEVYRCAGETLELAQFLEEALALSIIMLFIIEAGMQKDFTPEEISKMIVEARRDQIPITSKPVTKKFQQNLQAQMGQVNLLVQTGSMGELKRTLESKLHVSPGGPSASIEVLQGALEARNHLCHGFFKSHFANTDTDAAIRSALSDLSDMKEKIQEAIGFANSLVASLQDQFPITFSNFERRLH
ncbi:hypothetical protein [Celeribacter sp.]|uniref:hypothetical protein n=1 Tax=Celeribacter sp. TaxID=1890673 RepID=UPI003A9158DB